MRPTLSAFAIALLLTAAAAAQPKITSVASSADFKSGIAPEGLATIFGTGLANGGTAAPNTTYPKKLADAEVFVCDAPFQNVDLCVAAGLLYAGQNQINFQVPASGHPSDITPAGVYTNGTRHIVVRVGGILDQQAAARLPFTTTVLPAAPAIFFMGTDCLIDPNYPVPSHVQRDTYCGLSSKPNNSNRADRGAITDQKGNVLTSANPARLGKYYTIWMTGLGIFEKDTPAVQFTMALNDIPMFGYQNSYEQIYPSYIGPSGFPGVYQVNFQLPMNIASGAGWDYGIRWPCGDYRWELSIDTQSKLAHSPPVQIPLLIKKGDVSAISRVCNDR
jgi:uncharacterized protein (TIGR03437 family)